MAFSIDGAEAHETGVDLEGKLFLNDALISQSCYSYLSPAAWCRIVYRHTARKHVWSRYAYSEKVLTHADYDYIYISPHLDDVPLSCGGTIVQQKAQGLNILIVTVFAGDPEPPFSPFVQAFHRAWQAAETTPYWIRKAEERKAMAILAVDFAWFDWLEILYRDPEVADVIELFVEPDDRTIHPQDAPLFSILS